MLNNIQPLISIGISFYNCEKHLDFAISSVLNQTYSNWELILINDGSKDNSLEIARSYDDSRIKIFSDGRNMGLSFRLNQLVDLASGEYFARMDADDIMHFDRLKIQVKYLEENLEIDVLGSYAYTIDNNNKIYGMMKINKKPKLIEDVFNNKCFIHPTIIAKTNWFKLNKYNNEINRMEDAELWSRTILKSKFHNIEIPLLFYRQAGVPYLSKYLLSQKSTRRLINIHFIGLFKFKLILINYAKCLFFLMISIFKLQNFYFKKRFNNLLNIDISKNQIHLDCSIKKKSNFNKN